MASATIVGENIYVVGGHGMDDRETNTVFMCSLKGLVNSSSTSQARANTWSGVADLPVVQVDYSQLVERS